MCVWVGAEVCMWVEVRVGPDHRGQGEVWVCGMCVGWAEKAPPSIPLLAVRKKWGEPGMFPHMSIT